MQHDFTPSLACNFLSQDAVVLCAAHTCWFDVSKRGDDVGSRGSRTNPQSPIRIVQLYVLGPSRAFTHDVHDHAQNRRRPLCTSHELTQAALHEQCTSATERTRGDSRSRSNALAPQKEHEETRGRGRGQEPRERAPRWPWSPLQVTRHDSCQRKITQESKKNSPRRRNNGSTSERIG